MATYDVLSFDRVTNENQILISSSFLFHFRRQLMHEMPVVPPQAQPMFSGPGPMPYGMPYMPPGAPQTSLGGPMGYPHPSSLPAYNGYLPPTSDAGMYAAGSAPPPPTPPIQNDHSLPQS